MTRRDYVKFANMLRAMREDVSFDRNTLDSVARNMVAVFEQDNDNFRAGTFLAFAGIENA